ncbi:MAG TPA: SDR family oxidoreductase [Pseudomonas sp.]|uniref:UDP-glucose 4-epimerase family protein n=1 Tax=Pseudomonas sp. TaxID=306 RepID=UPI002ED90AFE
MPTKLLITGASGFLGGALVNVLSQVASLDVVASSRSHSHLPDDVVFHSVSEINSHTDWSEALNQIEVLVHTAARVHIMNDTVEDPLALFRAVNTAGTLNLARQAAAAGVKRFIFISSVKVNGESTSRDGCFSADDPPQPTDAYAVSKYEAEQGLLALSRETSMEVVIIRPVLVYGPGVKANFLQLMRLLHKGIPLPLGAIHNRRSFVGLENLIDFIRLCIDHPAAANQIFLVSDGHDVSSSDLARAIVRLMGSKLWLPPIPGQVISLLAKLLGREAAASRLLGSLRVSISKNRERLNWSPPVSLDDGLKRTVEQFLIMERK